MGFGGTECGTWCRRRRRIVALACHLRGGGGNVSGGMGAARQRTRQQQGRGAPCGPGAGTRARMHRWAQGLPGLAVWPARACAAARSAWRGAAPAVGAAAARRQPPGLTLQQPRPAGAGGRAGGRQAAALLAGEQHHISPLGCSGPHVQPGWVCGLRAPAPGQRASTPPPYAASSSAAALIPNTGRTTRNSAPAALPATPRVCQPRPALPRCSGRWRMRDSMAAVLPSRDFAPLGSMAGQQQVPSQWTENLHVLLIDDEAISRLVVGNLLRKCNYKGGSRHRGTPAGAAGPADSNASSGPQSPSRRAARRRWSCCARPCRAPTS
jgi:hypothetical protein